MSYGADGFTGRIADTTYIRQTATTPAGNSSAAPLQEVLGCNTYDRPPAPAACCFAPFAPFGAGGAMAPTVPGAGASCFRRNVTSAMPKWISIPSAPTRHARYGTNHPGLSTTCRTVVSHGRSLLGATKLAWKNVSPW